MKKLLYNLKTINFANFAHPLRTLRLSAFLLASTMISAQAKISLEKAIELAKKEESVSDIFEGLDVEKLQSCMTLFASVQNTEPVF